MKPSISLSPHLLRPSYCTIPPWLHLTITCTMLWPEPCDRSKRRINRPDTDRIAGVINTNRQLIKIETADGGSYLLLIHSRRLQPDHLLPGGHKRLDRKYRLALVFAGGKNISLFTLW